MAFEIEKQIAPIGANEIPETHLHRRHLSETQRAVVASRLANLSDGQKASSANLRTIPVTQNQALTAETSKLRAAVQHDVELKIPFFQTALLLTRINRWYFMQSGLEGRYGAVIGGFCSGGKLRGWF